MKQVLDSNINLSRYLIPDGDHRDEGIREQASSALIMVRSNQGSIWYHFYNVFGKMRSPVGIRNWNFMLSKPTLLPLRYGGGKWRFHFFGF